MSNHTHHQMSEAPPAQGQNHGQKKAQGHALHIDHSGHEKMFRNRFWVCLLLSIPVLIYSPSIQGWLGYTAPAFPGSQWLVPVLSTIIFLYGGLPFLRMSATELRDGKPGMMTLISLAISVAYGYSMITLLLGSGDAVFW